MRSESQTVPLNSSSAETASPPTPKNTHEDWIDVFRGFAIIAVVFIHILPRFYRLHSPESKHWWVLFTTQRFLFFAVPAFLLLSAMMNTRSLRRKPDLLPYVRSRLLTVGWPYLLWSLIYIVYQRYYLPAGFSLSRVPDALRWGTAWGHLYFFVVLIQLLLVLPLVTWLLRRTKAPYPWWGITALTVGLSALVYYANRYSLHLARPGSNLIWYLPSVLPGLWLGFQKPDIVRPRLVRGVIPLLIIAVCIGMAYRGLAAANTQGRHIDTMHYQVAEWGYGATMSLVLLGVSVWLSEEQSRKRLVLPLALLGRYSFPIYLVHPLILLQLDGYRKGLFVHNEPLRLLIYGGAAILLPMVLAFVTDKLRVSPLLFGRKSG